MRREAGISEPDIEGMALPDLIRLLRRIADEIELRSMEESE